MSRPLYVPLEAVKAELAALEKAITDKLGAERPAMIYSPEIEIALTFNEARLKLIASVDIDAGSLTQFIAGVQEARSAAAGK